MFKAKRGARMKETLTAAVKKFVASFNAYVTGPEDNKSERDMKCLMAATNVCMFLCILFF